VLLPGLLLSSLAAPAPAHAAEPPYVGLVGSVYEDLGRLEVRARSDSPVTQIRARILSPETGQVIVAVDDLQLVAGSAANGVWQTPDTLKLPALGDYPVEVEAIDADGDQWPWSQVGQLSYWILPFFEPLRVDPTIVDLEHRTVTVAGRLVGQTPDTRERRPLGGSEVRVGTDYDTTPVETDVDGRFSVALEIQAATHVSVLYYVSAADETIRGAHSDRIEVVVDKAATRITAQVDPPRVHAGEEVVVSGVLEYETAAGWRPYGAGVVDVRYEGTPIGGPTWDVLTTDAQGRFSLTMAPPRSGTWGVTYFGIPGGFYEDTVTIMPVQVVQSVAIADFTAARQGRQVTVGGRLAVSDAIALLGAPVDIEYSRSGRDGWTTVATLTTDGDERAFSGQVPYRGPGYWRAHFRGDGPDFPPALSDGVRS
jgi:hypothetical protein